MLDFLDELHTKFWSKIHRRVRLPRGNILMPKSRKTAGFCPSYNALKSGGDEVSEERAERGISGTELAVLELSS